MNKKQQSVVRARRSKHRSNNQTNNQTINQTIFDCNANVKINR